MMTLLTVIGTVFFLAMIVLAKLCMDAPMGYEDENGFHIVTK